MKSFVKTLTIVILLAAPLIAAGGAFAADEFRAIARLDGDSKPIQEGDIIGVGEDYTLGAGDVIEITVRNQPEFSDLFIVQPDGNIQYKFIGDVSVKGLTKGQVKTKLTGVLDMYVKIPEVGVAIRDYQSKFIFVFGEVNRPGKYPMKGDELPLFDALVEAGLPTLDAAVRRVIVIKPGVERPIHTKVDVVKLLYHGKMDNNVTLGTGDIVFVPSTVPTELNRALTKLLSPFSSTLLVGDSIRRTVATQ
ncbi:MAG: polysaccharide biosynthesis/export family protein [Candidatus Omnitrophota bacterium]